MKKKIVCAMMCMAMVATTLAGCGSKADDNTTTDNAATDDAADAADETTDAAEGDTAASGEGKVYYQRPVYRLL